MQMNLVKNIINSMIVFSKTTLRTVLAAVSIFALFSACTSVDDTLGSAMIPSSQDTKIGAATISAKLDDGSLNPKKYIETRLFQSDSIVSSNLTVGYMGQRINDTIGSTSAGFMTQFVYSTLVEDGYFGYDPIIDSVVMIFTFSGYGADTITPQKFEVYEINQTVDALNSEEVSYTTFDPTPYYDQSEPLFSFVFPNENVTGPSSYYVTVDMTDAGKNFIKRLMIDEDLAPGESPTVDYSMYEYEAEQWVEQFKGLYIKPAGVVSDDVTKSRGTIYNLDLSGTGFTFYARNRVESDPTLIQDTVGATYSFYVPELEYQLASINSIEHDYAGTAINEADIVESNENRPENSTIYITGLGGVISELTFTQDFFDQIQEIIDTENATSGENYGSMAFNQVMMQIYFPQAEYNYLDISTPEWDNIIDDMNASISRIGAYTDYSSFITVSDYDYYSESNYGTALPYGGYINRTMGCYKLDISAHVQQLWLNYLDELQAAQDENRAVDLNNVDGCNVYLGPDINNIYTDKHIMLQGESSALNSAPIKLDLIYTLIK